MTLNKKDQRLRRSRQTRVRIAKQEIARLTVHRTNLHIYASVISDDGTKALASTLVPKPTSARNSARPARAATWPRLPVNCARG